jgi:hypothetical protein
VIIEKPRPPLLENEAPTAIPMIANPGANRIACKYVKSIFPDLGTWNPVPTKAPDNPAIHPRAKATMQVRAVGVARIIFAERRVRESFYKPVGRRKNDFAQRLDRAWGEIRGTFAEPPT